MQVRSEDVKFELPFVLVLDMQGTLVCPSFKLEGKVFSQHELLHEYKDALPSNTEVHGSVVSGTSSEGTFNQLKELEELGIPIYIATGDGAGKNHVKGSLSAEGLVAQWGNKSPIKPENIINWSKLEEENFQFQHSNNENPEKEVGKNPLIQYIMRKKEVPASKIFFLDDGPGNINKAKKLEVEHAYQINIPENLTQRLDQAIALAKKLKQKAQPIQNRSHEGLKNSPYSTDPSSEGEFDKEKVENDSRNDDNSRSYRIVTSSDNKNASKPQGMFPHNSSKNTPTYFPSSAELPENMSPEKQGTLPRWAVVLLLLTPPVGWAILVVTALCCLIKDQCCAPNNEDVNLHNPQNQSRRFGF